MVGQFFTTLFQKIAAVVKWFSDLFVSIFVSAWDIFKDVFSWVFEQLLEVVVTAVSALDVSGLQGATSWGSLSGEILNILALLGVGQAVAIILAAISIRLAMQLIPFVRLGS